MALMDDLGNEAKDVMGDPQKRAEIEQMARDKGITIEQAKEEYLSRNSEV